LALKDIKDQLITKDFSLYCGDCCEVLPGLPKASVGLAVFSPPFASLYSYSDDPRDMGNSKSYQEFFEHFGFLIEQLQRVMLPGRIVSVHCMHLPTYKKEGVEIGFRDFPGDIIRAFQKEGFILHSPPFCIWKDPLIAATRTKAIGLAHKQIVKDSAMCRVGLADYLVAFRKHGENAKPIDHPYGLTTYCGSRPVPSHLDKWIGYKGDQGKNKRSHWIWQQYASPVWFDIRQTYVLPYRKAREGDDEKHICPLQLDVIERCVALWSAPGDVVLTPFMGVGSEVYVAVKNGRKAVGVELKRSYFKQAVRNVQSVLRKRETKGLLT
jgi:DNA modification methylase